MAVALDWRTVTDSREPKFVTKGTELAFAIVPHTQSRFGISEIRIRDLGGFLDRIYAVRDAATVSDAEVREGKRSRIVGRFATLDEALAFIEKEMAA